MTQITMRQLLEAGVHFGHRARNPKMDPYLFGVRGKLHIINLEKTLPLLQEAVAFAAKIAANHGKVLFVGTKRSACESIEVHAKRCGMPYINMRWLGGMLTNYKTIKNSIKRLVDLESAQARGDFAKLTKKEHLQKLREIDKLNASLGGIKSMGGLPDALFIVDVGEEHIALREANKMHIPVIGVVDSNHIPDQVQYLIPGNDDALSAVDLYVSLIADAILQEKEKLASTAKPDKAATVSAGQDKAKKRTVVRKKLAGVKVQAKAEGESANATAPADSASETQDQKPKVAKTSDPAKSDPAKVANAEPAAEVEQDIAEH